VLIPSARAAGETDETRDAGDADDVEAAGAAKLLMLTVSSKATRVDLMVMNECNMILFFYFFLN